MAHAATAPAAPAARRSSGRPSFWRLLLNNRLAHWIPRLTPADANLDLETLRGTPEKIRELAPAVADGVTESFSRSLSVVFWCLVPIGVVWLVLALALPNRPLRCRRTTRPTTMRWSPRRSAIWRRTSAPSQAWKS